MPRQLETTITLLEMTKPPHRSIKHSPPVPVAILKADNPPVQFYRYLFTQVGRDYYWPSRADMSDKSFISVIEDENTEIHFLYYGGWPGGFCESGHVEDGVVEIRYFGLVNECMGIGIGSFFFGQMLHLLWSEDIHKILIETCTLDHVRALPLYQKYGFTPYGQVKKIIKVPS